MAKKYFIYQGYMHEVDRGNFGEDNLIEVEEEEQTEYEPEKTPQNEDKPDIMKISPDRMYKWLVKKEEMFREV